MFFLFLIILIVVVIAAAASSGSGNSNGAGSYHGRRVRDYDDFEDYETRAARSERDYFTDDLARDYDSYYAQVSDAADMGDQDAIDERYGEFGDEEW